MGKRKDLSEFDKGQIVIARRLDQSMSKAAVLVGCSRSAVVSIYQKWSKKAIVVNRRQSHGLPRLIDARVKAGPSGKMGKRKDLSEFGKGQIVMARPLDQSTRQQGHGQPRLIDACRERRLARVIRSNRRATVAQIAEEVNAGSDRKVSEYKVHDWSGLFWQQKGDQHNIR
ncbi:hypothetical protein QTP70_028581 [Hemibagrus guttatus]|uniref:Transposase n=1 Tax=Hemibagrus guttatus TaxID=175788 RepID=A0AAE0UKX7_9TELE|nr:hypothetical protein QTP70_028581 [Hemibagrus guttatus]